MDKSLLVPKTVNWSKSKEEGILTYQDFLLAADKLTENESVRVLTWYKRAKEYADFLDQRVRNSFIKP